MLNLKTNSRMTSPKAQLNKSWVSGVNFWLPTRLSSVRSLQVFFFFLPHLEFAAHMRKNPSTLRPINGSEQVFERTCTQIREQVVQWRALFIIAAG